MTLNFPSYPDLPLEISPLKEVIFQVKFAPLLEIVQNLPTGFQKHVRRKFTQFEVTQNVGLDVNQPLPSEYAFKSPDNKSRITLAVNFLALSTKEYSHWNIFEKDIRNALEGFKKTYDTIFVSRIGLRYINELNTNNTHLDTIEEILGIVNSDLTHLAFNAAWSLPKREISQLSLDDGEDELTIRFAFETSPKPTVLLDFDYFATSDTPQPMETAETLEKINKFHKGCYDVFRWSIRNDKLDIFGPKLRKD